MTQLIDTERLQEVADLKIKGREAGNTTLIIQNILALARMNLKVKVIVVCEIKTMIDYLAYQLFDILHAHKIGFVSQKGKNLIEIRNNLNITFKTIENFDFINETRGQSKEIIVMYDPADLILRFK